jgi:chaperonin GroEL
MELHEDALKSLLRGVKTLARAVSIALKGRNVIIAKNGTLLCTKDGALIAKEVVLKNKYENMGAKLVKEAAIASDDIATTIILAEAIFSEGFKSVSAGANPEDVKRGIDKAVTAIESTLEKSIKTPESIELNQGYLSPYFVTNAEKMSVEFDHPSILLTDKKLSLRELLPILEKTRPLLIIAKEIEEEALSTLIINKVKRNFPLCAIKAPEQIPLEKLAVLTGATLDLKTLGSAKKIIISKDSTIITHGKNLPKHLKKRAAKPFPVLQGDEAIGVEIIRKTCVNPITKSALKHASSVAGLLLTVAAIVPEN